MKVNVEKKKIKVWNFYGSTNVGFMKQLFITESRKKNKLAYLLRSWAWRLPTCPQCCTRCGRTPGMCNQQNLWASDFLASALWSRPEKEKKTQTAMTTWQRHSEKALMLSPPTGLENVSLDEVRRKHAYTDTTCYTNLISSHYYMKYNNDEVPWNESDVILLWAFHVFMKSSVNIRKLSIPLVSFQIKGVSDRVQICFRWWWVNSFWSSRGKNPPAR